MKQLSLIINREYRADITSRSFWIGTILFPIIMIIFGGVIGYLSTESDSLSKMAQPVDTPDDLSGMALVGMMAGMFLTLFIMIYGAQIYNKVKVEKTNRISEIIAGCVPGRIMMFGKIIAVGLTGLTQLLLWGLLIAVFMAGIVIVFAVNIPWSEILTLDALLACIWGIIYFIGGYLFYGSLFAAFGAMSDKNNENQEYMSILTFVLLASFYIGMFAVDNLASPLTTWCLFIPFTAPTIGAVYAITPGGHLWMSLISVVLLYAFAVLGIIFSGKIYTAAIMMRGKRLSPADLVTFICKF